MEWFISLSPVLQGLTATIFTWSVTALGAALVFFFKNVDRKILNSMLGFGAGVMTAADRKSTRLNSSHLKLSRMPSSA